MKYLFGFLLCFMVVYAFAAKPLRIKDANIEIFKKKSGSESKGVLAKGDMVSLLKKGKNRSLVKTRSGVRGWVPNSSVEYIKRGRGDVYKLSEQEIHGWLDNPSAIYILDESGSSSDALPLSRSFADEIFEIQDREEIERSNDEN
jgi:hypothetical protein